MERVTRSFAALASAVALSLLTIACGATTARDDGLQQGADAETIDVGVNLPAGLGLTPLLGLKATVTCGTQLAEFPGAPAKFKRDAQQECSLAVHDANGALIALTDTDGTFNYDEGLGVSYQTTVTGGGAKFNAGQDLTLTVRVNRNNTAGCAALTDAVAPQVPGPCSVTVTGTAAKVAVDISGNDSVGVTWTLSDLPDDADHVLLTLRTSDAAWLKSNVTFEEGSSHDVFRFYLERLTDGTTNVQGWATDAQGASTFFNIDVVFVAP